MAFSNGTKSNRMQAAARQETMHAILLQHALHLCELQSKCATNDDARDVLNRVLHLAQCARTAQLTTLEAHCLVSMLAILSCDHESRRVAQELKVDFTNFYNSKYNCNAFDLSVHNDMYPPVKFVEIVPDEIFTRPQFSNNALVHSVLPTTAVRMSCADLQNWFVLVMFLSATDFFHAGDVVGLVDSSCRMVACDNMHIVEKAKKKLMGKGGVAVVFCAYNNPQRKQAGSRAWMVRKYEVAHIWRRMLVWHVSVS